MREIQQRIGSRLQQRRERLGWTMTKVAALAEISQGFYSRIERGLAFASPEVLVKVGGALGMSLDRLYAAETNLTDSVRDFRAVPVLDYVQAGRWSSLDPKQLETDSQEKISINLECPPSTFALRIRGNSMEPRFNAGDDVVINPMIQPKPGDFVVATDENGDATFKQYRSAGINERGQQVFELVPLNPIYAPMRSDRQQIAIVGVMIEHRAYRRF